MVLGEKIMSGVDHRLKLIWIHVPKTGGRSIENAINIDAKGHRSVRQKKIRAPKDYLSAAFVRHPADRLWSAYNSGLQYKRHRRYMKNFGSWETFVDTIDEHYRNIYHTLPMTYWLCIKNKLSVDFIGRFENIHEDYEKLCDILNVPANPLPHLNKSKHIPWQEACNKKCLKKIEQFYRKDFELFNYPFGDKND